MKRLALLAAAATVAAVGGSTAAVAYTAGSDPTTPSPVRIALTGTQTPTFVRSASGAVIPVSSGDDHRTRPHEAADDHPRAGTHRRHAEPGDDRRASTPTTSRAGTDDASTHHASTDDASGHHASGRRHGADDGAAHDAGDDHGGRVSAGGGHGADDGAAHDAGDDHGGRVSAGSGHGGHGGDDSGSGHGGHGGDD